jgi:hypothetical protein
MCAAGKRFDFTCSGGDELSVITSVEKQDNLEVAYEALSKGGNDTSNPFWSFNTHYRQERYGTYSPSIVRNLAAKCWERIDNAVALGDAQLLMRHTSSISSAMSQITLTKGPHVDQDPDSALSSVLPRAPSAEEMEFWRTQALFDLSRYLFLSSSTKAASNLQGLWTDGRQTLWLGDYHMNINMQMHYWASDVAGLADTLPPLFEFIQRIAQTGHTTAKSMYGVQKGWVAHGFMDGYLDGGLSGGYHWSLCVTCGAWSALSLWEHVSFSGDMTVLKTALLPAFKGIAEFFLEYMFKDAEGEYQTGPTCSPENSYLVEEGAGQTVVQLTFTPAIDASVLRQVSNAYALAIEMVKASHTEFDRTLSAGDSPLDLEEHSGIAERFRDMIRRMPYGANPVVGVKTGYILEYPTPFPGALTDAPPNRTHSNSNTIAEATTQTSNSSSKSLQQMSIFFKTNVVKPISPSTIPSKNVKETADPGHRHFSSLHWLYPGTFLPSDDKLSGTLQSRSIILDIVLVLAVLPCKEWSLLTTLYFSLLFPSLCVSLSLV